MLDSSLVRPAFKDNLWLWSCHVSINSFPRQILSTKFWNIPLSPTKNLALFISHSSAPSLSHCIVQWLNCSLLCALTLSNSKTQFLICAQEAHGACYQRPQLLGLCWVVVPREDAVAESGSQLRTRCLPPRRLPRIIMPFWVW
jgi:hypothetical protein